MKPADIRIASNGDVWIRVDDPHFGPMEYNKTRLDAAASQPIKFLGDDNAADS